VERRLVAAEGVVAVVAEVGEAEAVGEDGLAF
jgi:hypothetical protein